MLPILLARSADEKRSRSPLLIIGKLLGSIFVFSLILKASTALIGIPQEVWQIISGDIIISGGIIIAFGFFTLFPEAWEKVTGKTKSATFSTKNIWCCHAKKGKVC